MQKFFWILISTIAFVVTAKPESALAEVKTRAVDFDTFIQHQYEPGLVSFRIPVPIEFAALKVDDPILEPVYWMRKSDMKRARQSEELPTEHGYMMGWPSMSVGYDMERDQFIGIDDAPAQLERQKAELGVIWMRRYTAGINPVVLYKAKDPHSGEISYGMFVALRVATHTAFIALRPPGNDPDYGDAVWAKLASGMRAGKEL